MFALLVQTRCYWPITLTLLRYWLLITNCTVRLTNCSLRNLLMAGIVRCDSNAGDIEGFNDTPCLTADHILVGITLNYVRGLWGKLKLLVNLWAYRTAFPC